MFKDLFRFLALAFFLVLSHGCSAVEQERKGPPHHWRSAPIPHWESAFRHADDRWRGADSVSSVPMSPGKTLWLFGDTWITEPGATGRQGGRIIRNSIALQQIEKNGPGRIEFFWQTESGQPQAAFQPKSGSGWLWPLSGIRSGNSLCLFMVKLVSSDTGLGFEGTDSRLLVISNPNDPPGDWHKNQYKIPFFNHTTNGDLTFGTASVAHDGFVYIYGIREDWTQGIRGRGLLVARCPIESLKQGEFSAWRFFSNGKWSEDIGQAAVLFNGAASEMSVSFLPAKQQFVAVYTDCGLSRKILARLAPCPEGAWGKPTLIWSCPESSWNDRYFCYAGKAHPELATSPDELIVTYAANSWDPDDHHRDLRLYWPRFIKVILD